MSAEVVGADSALPASRLDVAPEPTEEEAAAIVAAVSVLSGATGSDDDLSSVPRWRFSGRWWSAPISTRRARP